MTLATELKNRIEKLHLLNHPFYQAWMKGELTLENLKHYATQYYPHVKAFPRFVSAVHSQCDDLQARRFLLENLMDEEGLRDEHDHPELWKKFGNGLGVKSEEFEESEIGQKAQDLVTQFWSLCRSSYAEGLAALYSYEYQVPEIAKLKISGLVEKYGITADDTLSFFKVHEQADTFHSAACAKLLDELSTEERAKALSAGEKRPQPFGIF